MNIWHTTESENQNSSIDSFIGGFPKLPPEIDIPLTKETNTQMTFYFQYSFPKSHTYSGFVISLFATTDFMHEDYTIPEMLKTSLKDADIPAGFLEEYQKYFKVFIYPQGSYDLRQDYKQQVAFHQLHISDDFTNGENKQLFANIGDEADWMLGDESPSTYNKKTKMSYLFQTKEGYEFETIDNATKQKFLWGDNLKDSSIPEYSLFNSNEIYFFGTDDIEKKVYILTQC